MNSELLKELSNADSVASVEDEVRSILYRELAKYSDEVFSDRLGSIIFHKKGTSPNPLKIMFCAHIDEVGFMVRHISDIGFVYLVALGSVLNKSKEMAQSLNNVSEAIQEMATTYRNTEQVNYGEGNNKIGNKQIFLSELLNNIEPYKENMLYEDIADTEGEIVSEIFDFLLDKQEITTQDLLKIFADCNSYVVGFEDKNISKYLEENISQMVRVINVSYKISKSNFIWRKKVEENQKNIGRQLNGVSKAIQSMAKDLEKDLEVEEKYENQKSTKRMSYFGMYSGNRTYRVWENR